VIGLLAVTGCTSDDRGRPEPVSTSQVSELPFGLRQIEGTSAIGRPAVYDAALSEFRGVPVESRRLLAAYHVTDQDPEAVVRAWTDQLRALPFERIDVRAGDARLGQWFVVTATSAFQPDEPPGAFAQLQLWATDGDPVLLVDVNVRPGPPPGSPPPASSPEVTRPTTEVDSDLVDEGDVLFIEQGQEIHLPPGTRGLMPALPTPAGTGGSTSVLSASDEDAAVRALLDDANASTDYEDVTGPDVSVLGGLRVVRASFVIPAGGWTFQVVAVRGPDDETATVYVTSAAD
jgi:hypothetical protein